MKEIIGVTKIEKSETKKKKNYFADQLRGVTKYMKDDFKKVEAKGNWDYLSRRIFPVKKKDLRVAPRKG